VTEHDQSRDRPGDEMVRLTVAEAASRLGISEAGVRKRVQRNQIPYERGDDGRLLVWISPGETRHAESRDEPDVSRDSGEASLVPELRDRIRYLERQVEEERNARYKADQLLARLLERVPELEPPAPPETPEPREPGPHRVMPERAEPVDPVDPRREEPERVQPERVEPERVHPRESPVTAADEQQGRDLSPMLEARRRAHSKPRLAPGGGECLGDRRQM
jgi:hypothetical protein